MYNRLHPPIGQEGPVPVAFYDPVSNYRSSQDHFMDKFMQTVRSAKTMVRTDQQNTRAHTALISFSFIDLGRGVPAGRPMDQ